MKFFELAVGDEFLLNEIKHIKVPEERISCCKVGCNAKVVGDSNSKVVVAPMQEVGKITEPPQAT